MAGAVVVPALAQRIGQHRLLLAGLFALPAALVLYGAAPTPWSATLALVGVGATYICVFSGLGTVVQLRGPTQLRARVVSLYFFALGTLYPLGAAIQGPIADRVGLGAVTVGAAIALLAFVVALRMIRPKQLQALDDVDAYPSPLADDGPSSTAPAR